MSTATIETDQGTIELELFDDAAPGTVANFRKLINEGFYDGLAFHRYVPDFVIQGGCPNTREGAKGMPGTGGPGYTCRWRTPAPTRAAASSSSPCARRRISTACTRCSARSRAARTSWTRSARAPA